MKKLLIIFSILFSTVVHGGTKVDHFISPQNIKWTTQALPDEVIRSNAFVKWKKELISSENSPLRWGQVSLFEENSQELIIQELVGGSGGLNSIVITKKNNKWVELISISGGFLFSPVPNKNHELVVYQRVGGDFYRTEFNYNGKKYSKKSTYELPFEFTRPEMLPVDFQEVFWFMNYGEWRRNLKR